MRIPFLMIRSPISKYWFYDLAFLIMVRFLPTRPSKPTPESSSSKPQHIALLLQLEHKGYVSMADHVLIKPGQNPIHVYNWSVSIRFSIPIHQNTLLVFKMFCSRLCHSDVDANSTPVFQTYVDLGFFTTTVL